MFVVSSRVRHTRCSLLTGVQTCALPIYSAIGRTAFGLGEFAEARRHLEQALALNEGERAAGSSETDRPESPVIDLCYLSWTSFALGEPEQALAQCRRSEEHTSELQSLMRISYAVFCLKKKKTTKTKAANKN